jgi:hypothetical protein
MVFAPTAAWDALVIPPGLGHHQRKEDEGRERDGGEEQKSDRVAEILNDEAGGEIAQPGADANAEGDETLSEIENVPCRA